MKDKTIIIDHIEPLVLDEQVAALRGNELNSLRYLAQGLSYLYRQVKAVEDKIAGQLPQGGIHFMFGSPDEFKWVPQALLACSFHWYSVSACNYARMVGWLAKGSDPHQAAEYVKRVLPEVYVWRNKVAAHFAITDPRNDDTPADLAMSVISLPTFENWVCYAGSLSLGVTDGGRASTSRTDMRWSLTKTHEELCPRSWPELLLPGGAGTDERNVFKAGKGDNVGMG